MTGLTNLALPQFSERSRRYCWNGVWVARKSRVGNTGSGWRQECEIRSPSRRTSRRIVRQLEGVLRPKMAAKLIAQDGAFFRFTMRDAPSPENALLLPHPLTPARRRATVEGQFACGPSPPRASDDASSGSSARKAAFSAPLYTASFTPGGAFAAVRISSPIRPKELSRAKSRQYIHPAKSHRLRNSGSKLPHWLLQIRQRQR